MSTLVTEAGSALSWLTKLLAEAEEVSDEQFKKFVGRLEPAEHGEQTFDVPREIANLLVFGGDLTVETERAARRHIADHIAGLGEEDESHTQEQCKRIQVDASFISHKVLMLKSLFWVTIWEHMEQPAKNFSIRKCEDTLVLVEINREEPNMDDLPGILLGTVEGGLGLLAKLFR